jgi:hypothetical protein
MNNSDNIQSAINLVGGEPLSGSGFENELPEPAFTDTEDSTE